VGWPANVICPGGGGLTDLIYMKHCRSLIKHNKTVQREGVMGTKFVCGEGVFKKNAEHPLLRTISRKALTSTKIN